MKSMIKSLVAAFMLVTGVAANAAQDIQIYTADNSKGKITGASIEKAFADAGFSISGNNDMNVAFKSKFQKTNHKMYHLFTLYKKDLVLELVKVSPKAALFAPLSMSIYMNKGSNDISISSLAIDGMSKVTGIPVSNKHMIEYSKLVRDTLAKALPNGHFEKTSYKIATPKGELITSFTGEMEAQGDDVEDELEGFQTELEGSLETAGFVIAGYNKLGDEFSAAGYDKYDFFDAYSICKLPVIFEVAKTHPEAGAFAPCTLYMYKEKGSTVVEMAYPSVYNWISSLDIEDKPSIKVLEDAQKRMVKVINEVTE
ncbi:DUF302 domain-containing protein [Sulfurimonas sp.]|uniref:DUF302 domain-containing protein n=1 Tax=Sulfurimonas sp. TaxID=2022749 RepID=UPI0035641BA7